MRFVCLFILFTSSSSYPADNDDEIDHVFYFIPTNKMTHIDNWPQKDKLCVDDQIVFEESENTAAYVDLNLLVHGMLLPRDGVIYFDDDVTLGIEDHRQCAKRKSTEDVFFDVHVPFGDWFDPNNWMHDHEPILHMMMVPSSKDEVYFMNHSLQMYLSRSVKVARMTFDGRQWTTEQFENLLYTVEGQFKVSLGHEIGKKAIFHDIEFNIPVNHKPIYIEKPELNHWDRTLGIVNSNSDPSYMNKICAFITCTETKTICLEPVKPFGHCCEVCGALINLTMTDGNKATLESHLRKVYIENELNKYMLMSIERMDLDAAPVEFQIALIARKPLYKPDGNSDEKEEEVLRFVEDKFILAVNLIKDALDSHFGGLSTTMIRYNSVMSCLDRSIKLVSKIFGNILGIIALYGIIYFVLTRDTPVLFQLRTGQLLNRIRRRNDIETMVLWRKGTTEAEDIILLENPTYQSPSIQSPEPQESEEETTFDDTPSCSFESQEDKRSNKEDECSSTSALISLRTRDGPSTADDIELSLIEL